MPTFNRPWRQPERLLVPLHFALYTYHRLRTLQPTDTHALLNIACEQLILNARNRVLERLTLVLESVVTADLSDQRSISDLTDCLIYAVMPHVVSMKKPKNVSCDGRRGNVHVMDGLHVDFAVIGGAF
jgi:hypothetical protein